MPERLRRFTLSLPGALLLAIGLALLAGIVPAGLVLDRWLADELKARARRDLEMAPGLLTARDAALHDAMMMHAKDLAHGPALAAAVSEADRLRAVAIADPAARELSYAPVLIGPDGSVWEGPRAAVELVPATRRGEMPVAVVGAGQQLTLVSLAPITGPDGWRGAVGVSTPLDATAAGVLAALTRSDVVVLSGRAGGWVANAGADAAAAGIVRAAARPAADVASAGTGSAPTAVRELKLGGGEFLLATVPLGGATVLLARDLRRDLSIVPRLRWVMLLTGLAALALAVLLGALLARRIARPVRTLAAAADRLSAGDFDAPLDDSSVREVERVTAAFREMRRALAARIEELRSANRLLEERRARLAMLQTELIQRERIATSARMVAELAHEIRNPVANVRNCLELIQRRLQADPEGAEYAGLAIDELLRMHELAERILDLNRPREPGASSCDAAAVAREVLTLARLGDEAGFGFAVVDADGPASAAIAPDALKQVLLNLVRNAREAVPRNLRLELRVRREPGAVRIRVADNGPGVPAELRERIFDPFFTTRSGAGGVGLGLFLVEGIVRANGGSVAVRAGEGGGACFEVVLPAPAAGAEAAPRARSA